MTNNINRSGFVFKLVSFFLLSLFTFALNAVAGVKEVAIEAAKGDLEATSEFRNIPAPKVLPILKRFLTGDDLQVAFATRELLRIGTDKAMSILSSTNAGDFIGGDLNAEQRSRSHYSKQKLDAVLQSIELAILDKFKKKDDKNRLAYSKSLSDLKLRLTSDEYITDNSNVPELHVISMYEALLPTGQKRPGGVHIPGHVDVNLTYSDRPIVLLLLSYEPILWKFNIADGVKIKKVYSSGYYESEIDGIPNDIEVKKFSVNDSPKGNRKPLMSLGVKLNASAYRKIHKFTQMHVTTYQSTEGFTQTTQGWEIGPGTQEWRAQHTYSDALALLEKITENSRNIPSQIEAKISDLYDENERDQAIKFLVKQDSEKSKEALLLWAKSTAQSEDGIAYIDAFKTIVAINDSRGFVILENVVKEFENGVGQLHIAKEAFKSISKLASKENKIAIEYLLNRSKSSIKNAKNDAEKAYSDLHRLEALLGSNLDEVKLLLLEANNSEVELISKTAQLLHKRWGIE